MDEPESAAESAEYALSLLNNNSNGLSTQNDATHSTGNTPINNSGNAFSENPEVKQEVEDVQIIENEGRSPHSSVTNVTQPDVSDQRPLDVNSDSLQTFKSRFKELSQARDSRIEPAIRKVRVPLPEGHETCVRCNLCTKPVNLRSSIAQVHAATHLGLKPFQCAYCEVKAKQKNNVTRHMRMVHNDKPTVPAKWLVDRDQYRLMLRAKHDECFKNALPAPAQQFSETSYIRPYRDII